MDAFFCCHGTMVQGNAALNRLMYYQSNNDQIYITQYVNSEADFLINSQNIKIKICQDYMNGSLQNSPVNDAKQTINETTSAFANKPDFVKYKIIIKSKDNNQSFTINLRIPDWIKKEASVYINQNLYTKTNKTDEFLSITKQWHSNDLIELVLPIGLTFVTLPDDNTIGAFRYGSEVLAGLTEQERVPFIKDNDVCQELSADTERNGEILEHFIKQKIKTQVLIL